MAGKLRAPLGQAPFSRGFTSGLGENFTGTALENASSTSLLGDFITFTAKERIKPLLTTVTITLIFTEPLKIMTAYGTTAAALKPSALERGSLKILLGYEEGIQENLIVAIPSSKGQAKGEPFLGLLATALSSLLGGEGFSKPTQKGSQEITAAFTALSKAVF